MKAIPSQSECCWKRYVPMIILTDSTCGKVSLRSSTHRLLVIHKCAWLRPNPGALPMLALHIPQSPLCAWNYWPPHLPSSGDTLWLSFSPAQALTLVESAAEFERQHKRLITLIECRCLYVQTGGHSHTIVLVHLLTSYLLNKIIICRKALP